MKSTLGWTSKKEHLVQFPGRFQTNFSLKALAHTSLHTCVHRPHVSSSGNWGIPCVCSSSKPESSEGSQQTLQCLWKPSRKAPTHILDSSDSHLRHLIAHFFSAFVSSPQVKSVFLNGNTAHKPTNVRYLTLLPKYNPQIPSVFSKDGRWFPSFPKDDHRNRNWQGLVP